MTKTLAWASTRAARPFSVTLLYLAAAALRAGSEMLAGIAARRHAAEAAARAEPAGHVEFHCEAGAPEGALYVDGKLAGYIRGVDRL